MLGIRQAYSTATKTLNFGIQGYHVQNKYFDPKNQSFNKKKPMKKAQTKKGSYLDDYVAIHGKIPGPGVYEPSVNGSLFQDVKERKINYPDKKTIFDQICDMQKREKRPAPGHYQPKTKKRPESAVVTRRPKVADRTTFVDGVQYQSSVTPGVGSYNPRPQSAAIERKDRMKPQDWRQKHQKQQKSVFKVKQPTPFSYNPVVMGKKDFSKIRKGSSTWGKFDRFKSYKSSEKLGPGKYMGHAEWGTKINFNSVNQTSSVYYR